MGKGPQHLGPYRLIRSLGRGGMGEVFLAHDPRLDRKVALKRIRRASHVADGEAQARFRREARIAAALDHPGIVRVHDLLEVGDDLVLVMEHVDGQTLRERIAEHSGTGNSGAREPEGLAPDEGLAIATAVARALAHAHARGVVHRDLKTENVLITPGVPTEGAVKIADFGIARHRPAPARPDGPGGTEEPRTAVQTNGAQTGTGLVLGTPRAMSPEQVRGAEADHRSDLFAFGVLLHEIFTGRSPFAAETRADSLARVLMESPPPLAEGRPDLPAALSDLAQRLLEKDPRLRPQDTREVVEVLDQLTGGSGSWTDGGATFAAPGPAAGLAPAPGTPSADDRRQSPGRRREDRRSRRRGPVALAALAAVAGVVALAMLLVPGGGLPGDGAGSPVVAVLPVLPVTAAPATAETEAAPESLESLESLSFGLRQALLRSLGSLDGPAPLALSEVDAVAGSGPADVSPRALAEAVGADEVIAARLDCSGAPDGADRPGGVHGECRLHLQRIRGRDAVVLWSGQARFHRDEPLVAAQAASVALEAAYPEHPVRPGFGGTFTDPGEYGEYLTVVRLLNSPAPIDPDPLLERLAALRKRSPELIVLHLQEARVAVRGFRETREADYLERAFQRLDAAEGLAPGAPPVLFQRLATEIAAGRLEAASATRDALAERLPADPRLLDLEATLQEEQGRLEEALALRQEAVERRASWQRLYNLARTAQLLGRTDLARTSLDRLLALVPDHRLALSQLARLELLAGRFERAAALYGRLAEGPPRASTLANLGVARLYLGDLDGAAAAFEAALERAPDHPQILLNLADARLLQGDGERARALYRRCVERAAADPSADSPGLLTVRAQALAHLGRHEEAVAAVQEAVSRAPDDGGVAFEAALVYALAGEEHSARAAARRAVEQGIQPPWFDLPWFAPLKEGARTAGGPRPGEFP